MNVTFISANEGKLEFYGEDDNLIIASGDALELAVAIDGLKLDLRCASGSSSLDFASEYGFATDSGAIELLQNAIDRV